MQLGALKRHWDRLGRHDPFWAALTDPAKERGGWNLDEFLRSGADEIEAVLDRAERMNLLVPRLRALDFGCGAGRLTQALADRFARADGVDISESMLAIARRHNRHPDRCFYHLNLVPDLTLFADGSFTFVYSTLVLQHMMPRYSTVYIGELVRVLAPGCLLVFQLPSHRAAHAPSTHARRTPITGRMPPAAAHAGISVGSSGLSLRAGEEVALLVTVENRSRHVWHALPDDNGRYQINLANHWLHQDGERLQRDDARCPLPQDLAPGDRGELMLGIHAPRHDGVYWLELDIVQENVGWFGDRGSETLRVPCRVDGGLPGPAPRRLISEPAVAVSAPPFRERHPRSFQVLRSTGLRDAYWAGRRAIDRVKTRRDRLVWWLTDHVYDRVAPRAVNWWLNRPFAARMDMHCVLRADVVALVEAAGGRVVDSEQELMPGGFQSFRYWVVKG